MKRLLQIGFLLLLSIPALSGTVNQEIMLDNSRKCLNVSGGAFYQWYYNGQKIHGATTNVQAVTASGTYSVEIGNETGELKVQQATVAVNANGEVIRIYIIGDSTVCNYSSSAYPQTGWGQMLPYFLNKSAVTIDNRAIGGRSSRSFYEEGRWTTVSGLLKTGDYVFIQFGHNDRDTKPERYTDTSDYKKFLTMYIQDTRKKGAFPVLISPMVMNAWNGSTMRNVFTEGANDYRGAMAQVAAKLKVPFIDLNMKSFALMKNLGKNYITRFLYHTYVAGEYPNYPNGITDGTHFQEMGAIEMARLVVQGISESQETSLKALAGNLSPVYEVAITSNVANAGLISRTATYPQGIMVTAKVIPSTGFTFLNWNNATSTNLSKSQKYSFTMSDIKSSYTAIYKTNVTGFIPDESEQEMVSCYPNPFLNEFEIHLSGNFHYTITTLEGQEIQKGEAVNLLRTGADLATGMYLLRIKNPHFERILRVNKR